MEKRGERDCKENVEGRFPLTFWEVAGASAVVGTFVLGLACVYFTMPASDYSFLKLPRSLEDIQTLRYFFSCSLFVSREYAFSGWIWCWKFGRDLVLCWSSASIWFLLGNGSSIAKFADWFVFLQMIFYFHAIFVSTELGFQIRSNCVRNRLQAAAAFFFL